MLSICSFALVLSILFTAINANVLPQNRHNALVDTANWMSQLSEDMLNKPLKNLAIPGSHDSFTYSLDKNGPIGNDEPAWLQQLQNDHIIFLNQIVYDWSVTQHANVTSQLTNGIRYFDFRLSHPSIATSDTDVRVLHGLYGSSVWDLLTQINTFLDSHPKEVVLLDWNHFYNYTYSLHQQSLTRIVNILGTKLCTRTDANTVTLAQLWTAKCQVILVYETNDIALPNTFWSSNDITSPWANTDDLPTLMKFIQDNTVHRSSSGFFVTQGIRTEQTKDVIDHLASTLEKVLASPTTEAVVNWLENNRGALKKYINIVIVDFAAQHNYTNTLLSYNFP